MRPHLAVILVALAACGSDNKATGDGGGSGSGSGSDADAGACVNTAGPPLGAPNVQTGTNVLLTKVTTLAGGQSLLVTSPLNDGRQFIVQQTGKIWIMQDGVIGPTPFMDVSNTNLLESDGPTGERGLLGLAFHPNYACNGRFYIFYTTDTADVLAEYHVKPTDNTAADLTSGKVILSIPDPYENHNSGMLEFGNSDGLLYFTTGDGGDAGDPRKNGQAIDRTDATCVANGCEPLLAKMLRIDVDHPANGKPYGIPASNPFAGGGGEPEILFRGLRNGWRWSFDRMTGDIYIGDVGQAAYEEIDVIPAAQINGTPGSPVNLGWSVYEGTHTYNANNGNCNGNGANSCAAPGLTMPLVEKSHTGDGYAAIIGGQVYRGRNFPGLAGTYYFTDYAHAKLNQGTYNPMGPSMSTTELTTIAFGNPSSIHADAAGELWMTTTGGDIYSIGVGN